MNQPCNAGVIDEPAPATPAAPATIGDVVAALDAAGLLDATATPGAAIDTADATPLSGCTVDSREVRPGDLFFCKGVHFEARFLASAVQAGASCYVAPTSMFGELSELPETNRACGLYVNDVRRAMAVVPPVVYGHPDQEVCTVGLTGTKGKSTAAYMLKSILEADGRAPGIIGSIDTDDGIEHFESHNTTPEAPELWRHLANCRDSGHVPLVMEVSSQGLKYDRVAGLQLSIACFLNIGRDHISPVEHADFEDYFSSKLRIFEQCDTAVVNLGCDYIERVLEAAGAAKRLVSVGVGRDDADFCANDVRAGDGCVAFELTCAGEFAEGGAPAASADAGTAPAPVPAAANAAPERRTITLGMPGLFNVENALVAIAVARLLGVPFSAIEAGLAHVRVPGRMELVRTPDGVITALVDYAHNVLSFRALYSSVAQEYPGHLVVSVFGAPGGKARERREQLPQEAAPYSDLLIFTEEDPAHERVEDICAEMASHVPVGTPCEVICDREQAIRRAFEFARESGRPAVLLLLAKGDETRQHRGDEYPTVKSDLALAREFAACM